jgi:bacteriorhodopsin
MDVLAPRSDVLSVNPPVGVDEFLSVNGSDWLWAVTALHIAAFVRIRFLVSLGFAPTPHN